MTYKTHMIGGALAGICVYGLMKDSIGFDSGLIITGASIIGSLLPDIDKEGSFISNRIPIGGIIEKSFGHRKLIHSLAFWVVVFMLTVGFMGNVAIGIFAGVVSHLVLDTFNHNGVPWMYPFNRKRFHVASIRTRGTGEFMFGVCLTVLTVFCAMALVL